MAILPTFTLLQLLSIAFGAMLADQPVITQADKDMAVEAHNKCRRETDANPALAALTWDDNLAAFGMAHAKKIGEAKCGTGNLTQSDHSTNEDRKKITGWNGTQCGENAALNWGKTVGQLLKASTESWCAEKQAYTIQTDSGSAGHYKQVVSQNTKKVGCGYAVCKNDPDFGYNAYVFCIYGAMKDDGRPYLHGASIDCSKIEDVPNGDCQNTKNSGDCDKDTYWYYGVCIKTCDGCSKPANGVGGSTTATTTTSSGGTGTITTTTATSTGSGTATTTASSGGYNTALCTPSTSTEPQSDGGKIITEVRCSGEVNQGYNLTCTETIKTTYDKTGWQTYQESSTSCTM